MGTRTIIFIMEKGDKKENVEFTINTGWKGIMNPFKSFSMFRKMVKYDKDGWMIIRIKGDGTLARRIKNEMKFQEEKGKKKAIKNILDFFNPLKIRRNEK